MLGNSEGFQFGGPARIRGPRFARKSSRAWWALLASLLIGCGADSPEETLESAAAVPAGVAPLVGTQGVGNSVMPSTELLPAFKRFSGPGVNIHTIDFEGVSALLLIAVDLDQLQPLIVGADGGRRIGVTAREALVDFDVELVVGSSFVSELNSISPVGLLQIEGKTISELQRHGYTRVLGARGNRLGVVSIREYHRGMFDSALQVGPGVVEAGLLDISDRDLQRPRYFRTVVATCGSTAMIGASQVPMNLYSVGKRFLEFTAELGLACDELVNLAGDREVVLAIASPDRGQMAYFGHPETTKAGLVGFRRL